MHKHVLGILVCMLLPICTSSLAKSPEEQAIAASDKNKTNKVLTKEQNSLVNELVIIDAAVPNKHLFFQHLKAGTDVVEINSSQSGFKQLESTLNKYKNLSALHLISHADDGVLYFGDSQITQQALSEKITLLSTMNHALTANADVLFYGCDLAKTEKGNALLDFISQQANVDVAASNNPTGSALQGGDWQLEVHKGDINTSPLFTASTMQDFDSVLAFGATLDLTALPLFTGPVIDVSIGGTDHVLKIESSGDGLLDIQAVLGHVLLASAISTHTSVDIYLDSGETFDLTSLVMLNLDGVPLFPIDHQVRITPYKGVVAGTAFVSDTFNLLDLGVTLAFSGANWEGITKITIESSDGAILKLLALSHISIANVVSLPSISNLDGDAFTYTEGSGVQKIDQGVAALLTDPGLLTGAYTGGTLTAEITSGLISTEDTLTIDTGVVSLANNLVGGALTVSGVIIGELVNEILPGNALSFTLNEFATPALLQILLQGLAYENINTDTPTAGVRVVSVTLTDTDGETSNVSDVSITVASQNDAPTLTNLDTDILSYVLGSEAQYLDQGDLTLVADVDSLNFLDGYLSVSITNNKDNSEDILSLGAGVDVSALVSVAGLTVGSEVSVGALVVGTLANKIIEGNDLLINLNADATILNIQLLIRALVYVNTDIVDPSLLSRTIAITLNDGDGGTSTAQLLTVNLAAPTYDNDGALTAAAVVLEPVALPLSADSIGEAVDIFDFTITDGGSSDSTPMVVSQVVVNVAGTISETDLAKITWRLNSNTPNTDVENVAGVYSSSNNTITFLTPALSIANGSSEILTVNAYYNDPTGLTHGNTLQLSIDGDTDLTLAVGSTMDGNSTPVTNGSGSLITDDVSPTVTSVLAPANGTYAIGDILSFTVNFDEAVNVDITAGTPRLAITIGENTRYIDYVSGDGSTALVFTYTLVAGDIDNDGLVLNTTLDLNSGTLLDAAGNGINTTLNNIPTLTGVLSDGSAPVLAEVTAVVSLTMDTTPAFTFSSNEAGTLDVGGACGSLNEGLISSGDTTIILTQANNLTAFASGTYSDCTVTVTDAAGNATILTLTPFTIDLTAPNVDVSAPNTLLEGASDVVITNTNLSSSDDNASAADITYTLVTAPINGTLSNTSVELGLADTFTQADIDNGDITYSHNGGESTSDSFIFTVSDSVGNVNNNTTLNFNFELTITPQNDAPTLLHLHDDTLNYVLNSGAQYLDQGSLTLVADVDSPNFDTGRLSVSITTNKDSSEDKLSLGLGLDASAAVSLVGLTAGSNVKVGLVVIGTLVNDVTEDNDLLIDLNADANIANIQLLIRALVYVNTDSIDPSPLNRTITITLEDGDGGTSTPQTINVSVTSAPIDSDGTLTSASGVSEPVALPLSANTVATAVDIFDFTITDGGTSDGTPTVISHVAINVSGTTNDTDKAKITWRLNSNAPNTDVNNVIGVYNAIDDTITFDTPTLSIADDSSEILTVNAYYNDSTGLTHGNTLQLSVDGSTDLTLAAGSEMNSTSSPVTNGSGSVITDDVGPIVTSVSAPADDIYAIGDILTFTVNFDEVVEVNTVGGTPRLAITIGETVRYVDYVSGDGTNALIFNYTLVDGDIDSDGLVLSASLDVNSATLADTLGNVVNTSLNNIDDLSAILLDGDSPVLAEVTAVVTPTMDTTPSFTFSSSEAGNLTVGGSCGSNNVGPVSSGNTTITLTQADGFTPLASGDYSDCTVTVTDAAGNATELTLTAFTIDAIAPVVSISEITLDEGATDTVISATYLSSTDNNGDAADITYTLVTAPSNGTLSNASVELGATDTFTQVDINNGDITYSHDGGESTSDTFTFTVSDAVGNVNNDGGSYLTFTVAVTPQNDAPSVLHLNGDTLNYVQGDAAQLLDHSTLAIIADADSLHFDNGSLDVSITDGLQATEDLLGLNTNVTLGGFLADSSVTINGDVIGTLNQDLAVGTDLNIDFNVNATLANVQDLVRAITYVNTSITTVTAGTRTLTFTLNDGNGGTSLPQTLNISVTNAPIDSDGTLTSASGVSEPVALPLSANTIAEAVDIFDFTITDGGTSDGTPTVVSHVAINVSGTANDTDRAKITWRLNSNAPNTDVGNVIGVYNAIDDTVTFDTPALSIADGNSEVLTVNAYYNDPTGLTHGNTLLLSINGYTDLTLAAGSEMSSIPSPVTNGLGSIITDDVGPAVTSVSVPADDTYAIGDALTFVVNFDEAVVVNTAGGTPRLAITIGETVRYVDYVSGTGTNALTFTYTLVAGDIDNDGLVLSTNLDINSGTLLDALGNAINTNLNNIPTLAGVLSDGSAPVLAEVTAVVSPTMDATPSFTFSSSEAGNLTVGGACGSTDVGSISSGNTTITLTSTDGFTPLTSGAYSDCTVTVTDAAGNTTELTLTAFTIDATAPTVSVADITLDEGSTDTVISDTYLTSSDNNASAPDITYTLVAAPSNGTLSNAGVELNSDDTFTQTDIENSDITYSHDGNESTSDIFTFTVSDAVGNVNDDNGSNLTFTVTVTPQNDAPSVLHLNDDTLNYVQGDAAQLLDHPAFALISDADSADFDGGSLNVAITTGKQASEDLLGFDINVILDGSAAGSSVTINSILVGTLTEELVTGSNLVIGFNTDATLANVQDLVRAITYVNTAGTVTTGTRTLSLILEDGDGGTSTSQTLNVSVTSAPIDSDGTLTSAPDVSEPVNLPLSANTDANAVDLFDFTITDGGTGDGTPMVVSHVAVNVAGSISDTDIAKITWHLNSNDPNANVDNVIGVYNTNDSTVTFDTPALSIADGSSEILTVNAYYNDPTGLTHGDTLLLNIDGYTNLTLAAGTEMSSTSSPVNNGLGSIITDDIGPIVTSVSAPTNGTYAIGDDLTFTVNFDEAIVVNTAGGIPRLTITIGATTRYVDYVSGSGSDALTFTYRLVAGDIDSDGLALSTTLDVNSGTLADALGNAINTSLNNIPTLTGVLADGDAPVLTEVTAVVSPTMNATPAFTFSSSEAGNLTVGGACGSSDVGSISSGNTTITLTSTDGFTPLTSGDYSDCTVTVTDAAGNTTELTLTAFTIDAIAPSVSISEITLDEGSADTVISGTYLTSSDNNDSAADITYTLLGAPSNGTLSKNTVSLLVNDTFTQADIDNGVITYTHDGGESTSDSFAFSLSDSLGNANNNSGDNFVFTLVVTPQNDAPNTANDIASTNEDITVIIDVLANDSDADGTVNKTSVSVISLPTNGNVSINIPTGTITYTPNPDVSGTDVFSYTVEDDQGQVSEPASVTVTIYAQNDAPVAQSDTASTPMNTLVSIDVAANDTDRDVGDSLNPATIVIVGAASNGTAVLNTTTNNIDYTPSGAFSGVDTFSYTIKDSTGATSNPATVSVTVTFVAGPANVAPTAGDDSANVQEDSSIIINVLANDSDSDGTLNTNSVSIVAMPSDGIISVNMTTGAITYTPNANFNGSDTFSYNVKDNSNDTSNTATVAITVTAVADVPVISGVPTGSINEDETYSFTPSVTSDDGNVIFTFSIENKPSWAVFDTTTGRLTGTPTNADVGTFSNIQITVSDGTNQASLPDFSLVVSNVNDAPIAINDSYLLTQNASGSYSLNVLENDYDEDLDDSITLVRATTNIGSVSINENGLTYQNSAAQTPSTIQYTIEDASGAEATAEVSIAISPEETDDTPQLILPDDIETDATALFTWLDIGTAEAFDSRGNQLAVEILNGGTLFPPGNNKVYWRAEDSEGNFVIKAQTVKVHPLINLGQDKSILEGKTIITTVYLNGDSPDYPLTVPYSVSGTANSNDHNLTSGEITFTSGRQASISFSIFDDANAEEDESIIISLGEAINRGSKTTQILTVTESNLTPEVDLLVTQSGEKRFIIIKSGEEALIQATITDDNSQDTHTTTWSSTIVNTSIEDTLFSFNPALLDVGMYTVEATIIDSGTPALSVTETVYLEITDELPSLSDIDSDGDSIPDNLEGHSDDDNDGIPNYLDNIDDCQILHTKVVDLNSYLMEGEAGACLRIGGTVANVDSKASLINTGEVDTNLGTDTEALHTGGIFDFIAYNLPKAGQSYRVVVPQRLPIPSSAVYRKHNPVINWHDFISDEKNKVYSTLGLMGYCPPPGSDLWTEGLTAGNWCVQLLIEDGGPNDDDGLANGTIIDPSGVASPLAENTLPVALDDEATVRINSSIFIDALNNDTDADDHDLTLMNVNVDFGTVTIENNQVLYLADSAFIGTTNITYTLMDSLGGTATATIVLSVVVNQAPTANDDSAATSDVQAITLDVLANDTDPENDTLTITAANASSGSVIFTSTEIVFTPSSGTEGIETVNYEISDNNGGTATGAAYIVVTINEAPIANSDEITINSPEAVTINVLENDSDADNDTIKVTAATALAGTVTFVDEHIVYTPPREPTEADTITYEISDAYGNTAESTVNVTIILKYKTEFKISKSGGSLGYLSILFFMSMMLMRRQLKVNKSR
ncbi:tandem-95 repeat protein [Pseudocolwellia sp. AS88]|uniref:Ig-like domain-containing protein n=1 Tax=Pseudocolwellia sp. AS88 TaxID=3063958 RepID=UPI0026E9B05B|nr:tandem-95 repeat protein [Pseudocolwellia sp. AS88]MDO7084179.1 tandem-95 repeat protein [Pseudocolwellia sp. AS88]